MPSPLMSAADVAERLFGDRERTPRVHELARSGVLPCVRLGRRVAFDSGQLEAFIAAGGRALEGGWRRERHQSSVA